MQEGWRYLPAFIFANFGGIIADNHYILYIFAVELKHTLTIMAIENGTNLKNYIEHLLSDIADNYEDSRLYAKLSKERPEGQVMLNEQEKAEFEDLLGV